MINLEGAGAGGREIIIQTGPKHSWIASAYAAHAPYPHGHSIAQEIFQSGLIPGDTGEVFLEFKFFKSDVKNL